MNIAKFVFNFINNTNNLNNFALQINNTSEIITIDRILIKDIDMNFLSNKTEPEIRSILEIIYQNYHVCKDNGCGSSTPSFCGFCNRYNNLCKYIDNHINQMYNFDDNKFFDLTKKYNLLNSEHQKLVGKYNKMRALMDQ